MSIGTVGRPKEVKM